VLKVCAVDSPSLPTTPRSSVWIYDSIPIIRAAGDPVQPHTLRRAATYMTSTCSN